MAGRTIPDGIQRLLALAAGDERFREAFVADPVEAARAAGVPLEAVERSILRAVPAWKLAETAARMPGPPPPRRGRSLPFARTAVAALSAGLISQAAPGCDTPGKVGPAEPRGEAVEIETVEGGPDAAAPDARAVQEALERHQRVRDPRAIPNPRLPPDFDPDGKPLYGILGPMVMPSPHLVRERQAARAERVRGPSVMARGFLLIRERPAPPRPAPETGPDDGDEP